MSAGKSTHDMKVKQTSKLRLKHVEISFSYSSNKSVAQTTCGQHDLPYVLEFICTHANAISAFSNVTGQICPCLPVQVNMEKVEFSSLNT